MTGPNSTESPKNAEHLAETEELAAYVAESITEAISKDRVVIPPFPAVALQVQRVLKKEDYRLADLCVIVEQDQALVAAVLKTANSSFYGSAQKVSSLGAAIGRIGSSQLGRVVVAATLGSVASQTGPLFALRTAVWRDSLLSAHLCQTLARARGVDGEAAFLCGMLHDIGAALALACAEDFLTAWPDPTPLPPEFWTAIAEAHHVPLGNRLVERWGLDDGVRDAVAQHHQPVGDQTGPLVGLGRASDSVIQYLAREQAPSTEDFARLPFVGGLREGKLIATTIADILAAVASFDVEVRDSSRSSRVLEAESTLTGQLREASFPVAVIVPDGTHTYTAEAMTATGLSFVGSGVLATNTLVRLEIGAGDSKCRVWANVARCAAERGKWRIEIAPVAMGAADKQGWNELFASLAEGGAAPDVSSLSAQTPPPAPVERGPTVAARPPSRPPEPADPSEPEPQKKGWWKLW